MQSKAAERQQKVHKLRVVLTHKRGYRQAITTLWLQDKKEVCLMRQKSSLSYWLGRNPSMSLYVVYKFGEGDVFCSHSSLDWDLDLIIPSRLDKVSDTLLPMFVVCSTFFLLIIVWFCDITFSFISWFVFMFCCCGAPTIMEASSQQPPAPATNMSWAKKRA